MRAFARMNGYVMADAMLFEIAANKNVSNGECVVRFVVLRPMDKVFGGKDDLKSSNK